MSNYNNKTENSSTRKSTNNNTASDQPLKRSTYNIYEAYESDLAIDYSLDASSIHPLQTSPYDLDMSPPNPTKQSDLTSMMKDLNLSSPQKYGMNSMPYCV